MTYQTATPPQPDLSACDREPIHIHGSIQPHGILLALAPDNLTISHASANFDRLLRNPVAGAICRPLADVLPTLAAALASDLQAGPSRKAPSPSVTSFCRLLRARRVS